MRFILTYMYVKDFVKYASVFRDAELGNPDKTLTSGKTPWLD